MAAHSDAIMWLAGLDPKRHRVCPRFLPLLCELHPKLQGVRRRCLENVGVRPAARAMFCCSLGVRTPAATGMSNAASDWAACCVITIRRQRNGVPNK